MNINELNRIRTINIDAEVAGTERGTGTFEEILNNVMSGNIIPIINNSGHIIGMSFDTKVTDLIQDSIAQRKFEIRYCCKPVMQWVLKALELKADRKAIEYVIENEEGIKVVTQSGEVIEIETYARYSAPEAAPISALPSEVEISYADLEIDNCVDDDKYIYEYLRRRYDHYLSGKHEAPTIEYDDEHEIVKVSNIHWGRKR